MSKREPGEKSQKTGGVQHCENRVHSPGLLVALTDMLGSGNLNSMRSVSGHGLLALALPPPPTTSVLHAHQTLVTLLRFLCPLPCTRWLCNQPSAHGTLLQPLSCWSIQPHPSSFPPSGGGSFWRNSPIPVYWSFCQLTVSTLSEHLMLLLNASAILWSGPVLVLATLSHHQFLQVTVSTDLWPG